MPKRDRETEDILKQFRKRKQRERLQAELAEAKEQEEALVTKRQKTAQMLADARAADEEATASELEARDKRRRLEQQMQQA